MVDLEVTLDHGKSYHVVVLATDESGGCSMTTTVFTVDSTPPETGDMFLASPTDLVGFYNILYA